VATDIELCIRCCACIKSCPEGARVIEDSAWKNIAHWLNQNCSSRKEPQMFGVDMWRQILCHERKGDEHVRNFLENRGC
jgi:ferredoxin